MALSRSFRPSRCGDFSWSCDGCAVGPLAIRPFPFCQDKAYPTLPRGEGTDLDSRPGYKMRG